jgi:hypothetical protein
MLLGPHCLFWISLLFILRCLWDAIAMFCSAAVDLLEQSKSPSRMRQQPVQEQSRAVASGAAGGEMGRSIQPLKTLGWSLVLTTHCDVTHPVHPRRLLGGKDPLTVHILSPARQMLRDVLRYSVSNSQGKATS